MSQSPIKPSAGKLNRGVKLLISAIYVLFPLALMAYRFYSGETVDTIVLLIVIIFMFASGYVIFGERIVDKATEEAKDISE